MFWNLSGTCSGTPRLPAAADVGELGAGGAVAPPLCMAAVMPLQRPYTIAAGQCHKLWYRRIGCSRWAPPGTGCGSYVSATIHSEGVEFVKMAGTENAPSDSTCSVTASV